MNKFFPKTCLHKDRRYKKICKLLLSFFLRISKIISNSKLGQNNLKIIKILVQKKKKFIEILKI